VVDLVVEWVLRVHMLVYVVGIRPIRGAASQHRSAILLVLPVVVWLRAVPCGWALVVRCGIVGLVVVRIVMCLRIEGVVAVMSLRSRVIIVVVVSSSIWDILYRVLHSVSAKKPQIVYLENLHSAAGEVCRPKQQDVSFQVP
jgi:hypothetical protein